MENNLLIETNRILELMMINEAGPGPIKDAVEILVKSISSGLKSEEKQIIIDVVKGVATSQEKKAKFATLMASEEGKQFVREMETLIAKEPDAAKRKLFSRELENLQTTARNWESLAAKEIAEVEAKKIINSLTEEAKSLFNQIISDINNLKSRGLGTNIIVDANKINSAASAVMDGTITKSSDYLSLALELQKLGIDLTRIVEKTAEIKSKQGGQNVQIVTQRLSMFNKICNSIVDFIRGNKMLMWALKLAGKILKWMVGISIAITLLMKAFGYAVGKFCNSIVGSALKFIGFCTGTSSSAPPPTQDNTEQPTQPKKRKGVTI